MTNHEADALPLSQGAYRTRYLQRACEGLVLLALSVSLDCGNKHIEKGLLGGVAREKWSRENEV